MKEVVTRTWCDRTEVHLSTGPVPGFTREPLPCNGKPTTLDLCDPCDEEVLEPIRRLLAVAGVPAGPPEKVRRQRNDKPGGPCPEPGCDKEFKTSGGLTNHRARKHGFIVGG